MGAKKKKTQKPNEKDNPLSFEDGFASAKSFRGSVLDWCFKLGELGQGYYKDQKVGGDTGGNVA